MTAQPLAKWTDAEKNALRKGRIDGLTVPQIAVQLGRPVAAVYTKARNIGALVMVRKTWTDAEDAVLRGIVARGGAMTEAARILERTPESARWRKSQLGLKGPVVKPAKNKQYEKMKSMIPNNAQFRKPVAKAPCAGITAKAKAERDQTVEKLRAAWSKTQDLRELATLLEKSLTWVRNATLELGLREKRVRKEYADKAAREEIRKLAATCSITDVAKALGRDVRTIRKIAEEMGFTFAVAPRSTKPVKSARNSWTGTARKKSRRQVVPCPPLPPAAMAARLKLIRKVATRMRLEGKLPPLN